LAGFPDPRPDDGQGGAAAATLAGLKVAKEQKMAAPSPDSSGESK
jgi:NADH-quinone oxidoreductase subunit E